MFVKVQDDPTLARDQNSNAIVSTDITGYNNFITQKTIRITREAMLHQEVNTVREELKALRELVSNIVNRQR